MTFQYCNKLVSDCCGPKGVWVIVDDIYPGANPHRHLTPPECLWYQEWWLATTQNYQPDTEYYPGGVLDGQLTEELRYFATWR